MYINAEKSNKLDAKSKNVFLLDTVLMSLVNGFGMKKSLKVEMWYLIKR